VNLLSVIKNVIWASSRSAFIFFSLKGILSLLADKKLHSTITAIDRQIITRVPRELDNSGGILGHQVNELGLVMSLDLYLLSPRKKATAIEMCSA